MLPESVFSVSAVRMSEKCLMIVFKKTAAVPISNHLDKTNIRAALQKLLYKFVDQWGVQGTNTDEITIWHHSCDCLCYSPTSCFCVTEMHDSTNEHCMCVCLSFALSASVCWLSVCMFSKLLLFFPPPHITNPFPCWFLLPWQPISLSIKFPPLSGLYSPF